MKSACFRCDASLDIGIGHLMRCITLAGALKENGWDCKFITAETSDIMLPILSQYSLVSPEAIPDLSDLLVVDHYDLDQKYETAARVWASKIMVIDDLADRQHDCDILLDQTFGRSVSDYQALIPEHCTILCGSDYTLLRPQFLSARYRAEEKRHKVERIENILVNFGSTNPEGIMQKILSVLAEFKEWPLTINIVTGNQTQGLDILQEEAKKILEETQHNINLLIDIPDIAEKMVEADLAFGAGGTTSWERACLGLPTIMIELADNQSLVAQNLLERGAVLHLGKLSYVTENKIDNAFKNVRDNSALLRNMSKQAFRICDGLGTDRVSERIEEICKET